MLQTAGCYRFMRTLEDKNKVVDDYIQLYFIYRNHVSIQRFKEGLAMLDFVNTLEQHPSLFFSFMCYTETKLTADAVENIFQVQFSQPGSTNRQEEATVLSYWRDYLLYLEVQGTLNECYTQRDKSTIAYCVVHKNLSRVQLLHVV
ncbi:G2/M phase-specific E3 ubiquitin-protein ligase-like [Sinocyclocheilus rhinocerous]|uniref:G2/M phase-specific E3 ubiquitin-protein ligase-like n=1 Tax=Sinocyclocheilus rhinocerous TaxID=307959 RepID=UPI0007B8A836|nr:PREDICTED: G2/M phase-specific E3 ubiquitin-protein ligase-like [Sinocyclocheilus rhinocerous]